MKYRESITHGNTWVWRVKKIYIRISSAGPWVGNKQESGTGRIYVSIPDPESK